MSTLYKLLSTSILFLLTFSYSFAQSCPCGTSQTAGDGVVVLLDGSTDPDYNQNSSNTFCIPAGTTYTSSSMPNSNGGSLTNCGTWAPSSDLNISVNGSFDIYNNGTIDAGMNDFTVVGNNTSMTNDGTIENFNKFEMAESTLINNSTITGVNVYLHGLITNNTTGTIVSTADCPNAASNGCGFFVGNKGGDFINDGAFIAVDFNTESILIGNGSVSASDEIRIRGDYPTGTTSVTFRAPTITLYQGNTMASGTFYTDQFNCNNSTFSASVCNLAGTAQQDISSCNSNSTNSSSCQATILPVKLKSFDRVLRNDYGILIWESLAEVNFSHYEIYSSTDLKSWDLVSQHNGEGRGSIYQSDKIEFENQITYFRLQSIDVDGSTEIHQKVIYLPSTAKENGFTVYPNPLNGNDQLTINSPIDVPHILNIYTINGKKVHSEIIETNGLHNIALSQNIDNGTYLVELLSSGINYKSKLIVQGN